ncbi:response regulator [Undibacterium parvum]|uniref:Response regulator n=1 Tax=Undibacterium parvum TaxID=401471 RepID=A0A3S9HFY3_9BURK|nr:response regulator [Undibacterium parvum]AZP11024.1 response regulator [Undibacterium parvum]
MFEMIISFFLGLSIGALSAWLLLKNKSKTKRERSKPESGNSVLASTLSDDQQTLGYETNLAWKTEQSVFSQVTGQAVPQAAPHIIEVGHPPLSEVQLELQRLNAKLNAREAVFYPDENALLQAEQDKLAGAPATPLAPPITITSLAPIGHETHNTQANEFEIAALVSSMQDDAPAALAAFDPSELEAVALASAEFDGVDFENEEQQEQDKLNTAAAAAQAAAEVELAAAQEAARVAEHEAEIVALQQAEAARLAALAAQREAQYQAQLAAELAEKLEQERAALAAQLEAEHAAHLQAQRIAEENAKVAAAALLALESARQTAELEAAQAAAEVERLEQERLQHEAQLQELQAAEQAAQLQASLDAELAELAELAQQAARLEAQRLSEENARIANEAEAQRAAEQAEQQEAQRVQNQLAAEAAAKAAEQLEREQLARAVAQQAQEIQQAQQAREQAALDELARLENQRAQAQKLAEQAATTPLAPVAAAPTETVAPETSVGPTQSEPATLKSPENTMIMVADDSKVVRIKISRALTKNNYQITLAENGIEAASKIAEARPDVLITDVEMPGMDGFGLTQQLRSNPATMHLPIIMISGASHELADKAKQAGIDVLLGKPYSDDELIGHIQRLLQR